MTKRNHGQSVFELKISQQLSSFYISVV